MPDDWRHLTLDRIGAPKSRTNLLALQLWALSEGISDSCHNPLGASDPWPGSTTYGTNQIVKCYRSVGDTADVYAMKFRSAIYDRIGDALRSDAGLSTIWQAINQSPWCREKDGSACQSGEYPNQLFDRAFGKVAAPANDPETDGTGQRDGRTPVVPFVPGLPVDAPGARYVGVYRGWDILMSALGITWPTQMLRIDKIRRNLLKKVS